MFRQYFLFLGVKIVLKRTVDVLIKPQPEKGKEDMKFDIAAAERALELVAQNNGVTVEEVREEIAAAISLASAQAADGGLSGTPPSPENLIAYAAEETVNRIMQLA